MGKKMHLHKIFAGEPFPNVQFKPRRSLRNKHLFQVECKLAGAVLVNKALKDKRLLIGTKYISLTKACLASNFTIRLMKEVKKEVKAQLITQGSSKELKEIDHAYIRVPHIKHADMDPFEWHLLHCHPKYRSEAEENAKQFDDWVRRVVYNLLRDKVSNTKASKQISYWANKYADSIISVSEPMLRGDYVDPPQWRVKINDYLAKALFNVYDTMGKPERTADKKVEVRYVFAPRITAVGAGPNMMPLVYHLHYVGKTLSSPCFFNKNFTLSTKSVKVLDTNKAPKWQKCFSFTDEIETLPRLHLSIFQNHNYYGGPFEVDSIKDCLKVLPWTNCQPDEEGHTLPHVSATGGAINNDDFKRRIIEEVHPSYRSSSKKDISRGGKANVDKETNLEGFAKNIEDGLMAESEVVGQEDIEMRDGDTHQDDAEDYATVERDSDSGSGVDSDSDSDSDGDGDGDSDSDSASGVDRDADSDSITGSVSDSDVW